MVEIEPAHRFDFEVGVTGAKLAPVLPRSDRLFVEPSRHRALAEGGHPTRLRRLTCQFLDTPGDRGHRCVAGNSHASALPCTTTSGGETPRAPGAGAFLQSRQALIKKALSPLTDNLAAHIKARGNLVITQSLRGKQDHLRTDHFIIRQRIFRSSSLQFALFL